MSDVKIPIYDVVIDDEQLGLTAVSFVKDPAIMEQFVAFSKEQMLWMSSHEKREIVSPILIPNQLILRRNNDGTLYYIRWTEEAIEQAAAKYLANGFWNNVTVEHPMFYDENLTYKDVLEDDVYMKRMWIVKDPATDDINTVYGFKNLPKGTLCVHYKVHNRKLWQKIKNKEVLGLSIEAFTTCYKTNNDVKLDINMNKLDVNSKQLNLFQKFINFLNEVSAEAEAISDIAKNDETDSGDVSLKYYIDDEHYIEVDAEGFARDEEYNLVAEGEYLLADGNTLVVDANNKFVETKAVGDASEEEPLEAPIAEKKVDDEDEEDKDETEGVEGEPDGEADDVESKGDAEGDTEDTESSDEENGETSETPGDTIPTEEPVEEVPTDEIPSALVPFEIDGVEFMLPQEVVDYINSLKQANEATLSELSLMKERMPSASPIPTVIKQGAVDSDETDGLVEAIRLLNRKR